MSRRILVADDDGHIREVVRFALTQAGYAVTEAADGRAAWASFAAGAFDLVVLDLIMPEFDGFEVCRRIRAASRVPVIFLSSRDEELDRVLGLELGADDYVTKPFSPRELVARVKAALRRYEEILSLLPAAHAGASVAAELIAHAGIRIDLRRHECHVGDQLVVLTVSELGLLRALLEHPGRVLRRAQLVEMAYGDGHFLSDRTVDSHIRRVRQKLALAGADPIETVYGVGYRLKDET
ncbi:MAG TPA: response regulator transcription factor [Polyangiaceae bacterium]|nr:response regulator transcription factor [Polyangiaceae bacterium]